MKRSVLPSVDAYTARCVESGLVCLSCGHEFVQPHGYTVACAYCFPKLTMAERQDIKLATYEEKNRVAHANEARRRRTIKEARQAK